MDKITSFCKCNSPLNWHNCYNKDSRYAKYFTPESNAHPAKMSWGLAERIFKHLKQLNLLKSDSTIIDFMAGTGRTNVMATLHGHRSIAIELEPHFCKMITDNKAQLEKVKMTDCDIDIIQADARNMSEILTDGGVGVVSPPYETSPIAPQGADGKSQEWNKAYKEYKKTGNWQKFQEQMSKQCNNAGYSTNPSNIGNLPDKPLVGVVSPPYSNHQATGYDKYAPKENPNFKGRKAWMAGEQDGHYSPDPTNIGNLPDKPLVGVVSPPYAKEEHSRFKKNPKMMETLGERRAAYGGEEYSDSKDNIGNLKDTPLVGITSPPYESSVKGEPKPEDEIRKHYIKKQVRLTHLTPGRLKHESILSGGYGGNPENIGNHQDDSYLSAMLQVYSQAYRSGISPLVVVTKNPTRNGKLRRLDLDTVNLLQLAGYKIIDYHRAILFKERNQMTLDGDMKKIAKGRLSFFKRLSYDKGGKVARWEDVIFAQKEEFIWKQ